MASEPMGSETLRRIEWLALVLGGFGTAWAGWRWGWRGAVAFAAGTVLAWINFRWLKSGVQGFSQAATAQAGSDQVRVPKSAYFKLLGRFALLFAALYVILTRSSLPVIPVFAGLFTPAAGVVVGLVWELLSSSFRRGASGTS